MRRAAVALFVGSIVSACAIAEESYETVVYPLEKVNPNVTCSTPFTKPDLATLKPCGDGQGHCFDKNKVRITDLPDCGGGQICVPDEILEANGDKLKPCTFMIDNKPGACVSLLVQELAAHKDQMLPDVCDKATERCAPCVDPRDGKDTKLCEPIGVHEGACTGGKGSRAPTCCHGAGVCMNESGVPEENRGDMTRDTCGNGKVCAPAAMVSGDPDKCTLYGIEGVCIDVCFAKMLGPTVKVARGQCRPTEVCMPCLIGKGQGMPGC